MGLDMYLQASLYLSEFEKELKKQRILIEKIPFIKNIGLPVLSVSFDVMRWWKATHIHTWFVDNCQDGIDDQARHYVSQEQLKDLLILCKKVLRKKKLAKVELPTDNDIDESYWKDIEFTIDGLNKIFKNPEFESLDFYYSSWW